MTSMNDNRLLTGPCRGIESPWWRTDSSWKCQGVSLLSKLRFPPRISWQIYNVYCLELDQWLLQCFLLRDPPCNRHHFTVMIIFYCFSYLSFILPSHPHLSIFLSFSDCVVTLALCLFLMPNYCVYLCFVKKKNVGKNRQSPYNMSWNQLPALTPPPERFGQLLKCIKPTPYLQRGILPLTS